MKTIAVLGSTGSIGTQTLEVARANGDLKIAALAAGRNVKLLERQIREFSPRVVAVWEEEAARELKTAISDLDVKIVTGMDGLIEISTLPEVEVLVTAIVGMIGIRPTVEAIKAGKDIALANKETLVTAGHIIMPLAKKHGVKILPVDSEHSAIFQSLNGEQHGQIDKLLITASGGPFRGRKRADLEQVKVEDALKHPNWAMGGTATECDSFHGTVRGWSGACAAGNTGYEVADTVCPVLSRAALSGRRKTGFCEAETDYI